ncbi:hypothetical protein L1080_036840 [Rhodococcus sp. MSC1_016]|jgi:hypothetical protein|uniref:hypothetical protein n=1 Tax=Rhodococcus sp. MSC1_016 TaxID=2909266 RepID=UPI00202FEF16|nr:hypothetical protein [Rhodococcus sp. MSC1_016]
MRSWTGGFEVLAGGAGGSMGAGVYVGWAGWGCGGGAWGGLLVQVVLEVLTHLVDAQRCKLGEDLRYW